MLTLDPKSGKLVIDPAAFDIPEDYAVTRESLAETVEAKRRKQLQHDPEMEDAINESLRELGWAQDPESRQAIIDSQRQAQHEMNLRLGEEAALQEAIKRSLT